MGIRSQIYSFDPNSWQTKTSIKHFDSGRASITLGFMHEHLLKGKHIDMFDLILKYTCTQKKINNLLNSVSIIHTGGGVRRFSYKMRIRNYTHLPCITWKCGYKLILRPEFVDVTCILIKFN